MYKAIRSEEIEPQVILGGPVKPIVNSQTVGSKHLRFSIGVFKPSEGLVSHIHPKSEEVYYVVKGRGTVYIGVEKEEVELLPEMALFISPGTEHELRNTGRTKLIIAFFVAPGREPSEETDESRQNC